MLLPLILILLPFKYHWYILPLTEVVLLAVNVIIEVEQLLNASVAPSVITGVGNGLNVIDSVALKILEQPEVLVTITV